MQAVSLPTPRIYPDDFGFQVTVLSKEDTGLPVMIAVDYTGEERDWEPQLYVFHYREEYGGFAFSLTDDPQVVYGKVTISDDELKQVVAWIKRNKDVLLEHWEGKSDSLPMYHKLKRNDDVNHS